MVRFAVVVKVKVKERGRAMARLGSLVNRYVVLAGGGDVWLWIDTPMDVLTVKFTERVG